MGKVKNFLACAGLVSSAAIIIFIKIAGWHYTQGEQLVYYWPLWLGAIAVGLVSYFIFVAGENE